MMSLFHHERDFLTDAEINHIHSLAENIEGGQAKIGLGRNHPSLNDDAKLNKDIRITETRWIRHMGDELENKLAKKIGEIMYINAWNIKIVKRQSLQYSIYRGTEGGKYTWHCDQEQPYKDGTRRELSFTILLESPEAGGLFEWKDETMSVRSVSMNRGDLIVFPSFVQHQVTPVTQGTRISLVSWYLCNANEESVEHLREGNTEWLISNLPKKN
jgi:PKHD-type hydroxylase